MKDLLKIDVYKDASLIVETTTVCNKVCNQTGCEYCPFTKCKTKKYLDPSIYLKNIKQLKKDSIVSIRGGEPTIVDNWFNLFIVPAINLGLNVILETNGYFINEKNYYETIKRFSHKKIYIRISFDKIHVEKLNGNQIEAEFSKMSFFAANALKEKVNFGFYYVGMTKNQIKKLIKGTKLEPFLENFYSLMKREDYFETTITRKYLSSNGSLLNELKMARTT